MRNITYKFFLFAVLLACWAFYFSVVTLDEEKAGAVEDLRINRIVRVFFERKNFIWQGAFPWWYSVYEISLKKSVDYEVALPVYGLEGLKGDAYLSKTQVSFTYRIIREKFKSLEKLGKNSQDLEDDIKNSIRGILGDELNRHFTPVYRGNAVNNDRETISANISNGIKSKYESLGVEILNVTIPGRIAVPDLRTYHDGIRHIANVRDLEKKNEIQLKALESRISQEKLADRQKYDRLNEMSKIIRDNPDILKYIFIEKMSDNVKVIISSDKTGFPLFLDDKKREKGLKEGDISNID